MRHSYVLVTSSPRDLAEVDGLDRYCPLAISLTEVDDERFIKTEMEQYPSRAEH